MLVSMGVGGSGLEVSGWFLSWLYGLGKSLYCSERQSLHWIPAWQGPILARDVLNRGCVKETG